MNINRKKIFIILIMNFLLAISTTIGMTIIPIIITQSLGLSLMVLGLIEGSTEFISNLLRLANGVLFDRLKNKKRVFLYSTGLAFIAKLVLLLPNSWSILFAKIIERMSNGAFASPRDAYVAENASNRGLALSFISVSKTLGCILGPLLVSFSTIFFGEVDTNIPGFVILCCSITIVAIFLSLLIHTSAIKIENFSFRELSSNFKTIIPIILLGSLFFLGRFNDGLLIMYLKQKGFPPEFYLSTIAIFNTTMLLVSPFIGMQIDKGNAKGMLFLTLGTLAIFNLLFFQLDAAPWLFAISGLIAWGIQRTGAQIVFSALVFKALPKNIYGSGIGLFYVITGLTTMLASFICGYLANNNHFNLVFLFSGLCACLAMLLTWMLYAKTPLTYQAT